MKILTFYSESHKDLYDLFMESISRTNPDITVHSDLIEQTGSGNFMENGWEKSMSKKLDQIIEACEQGEIFIHSDSDVYFFDKIRDSLIQELDDFDIAFQDDGHVGLCMGFFVCRPNQKVIKLFKSVKEILSNFNGHDQNALNSLIETSGVKYKRLSNLFFNYGQKYGKVWDGEDFDIDPGILLLHANWVIGVKNKIDLISHVAQKIKRI
jgi:hypothetical protein